MSEKLICIGLAIVHGHAFFQGVLRGIRHYADAKPRWLLVPFVPERGRGLPHPYRPDGLIAAVSTPQLADSLASCRQPVVNVSAAFSGLRFPRVGVEAFARLDGCGTDAALIGLAKACPAPAPGARPADAAEVAGRVKRYRDEVAARQAQAERES
jgi:hypothetical protein